MKIIEIEQRTDAWHEWRRSGIGGSDIAAICGVSPYKTPLDVYNEKLGDPVQPMTSAMQRGVDYEGEALQVFIRSQGKGGGVFDPLYTPVLCEHYCQSFCIASLDGYCDFNRCIVEIKIPSLKVMDMARYGQIPLHYIYQIQWQLFVSKASKAYYFVYHPESLTSYTVEVFPDEDIQKKMFEKAYDFWGCFLDRKPPISSKQCSSSSAAVFKRMIELKKIEREVESEYRDLLNILLQSEGEDLDIECDLAILSKAERSSVDYKQAAIDARLDLDKYKKPTTKYWTIREKKI